MPREIVTYTLADDVSQTALISALKQGDAVECVHPNFKNQSYFLKMLTAGETVVEVAFFQSPNGYVLPDAVKSKLNDLGVQATLDVGMQAKRDNSRVFLGQFETKTFNDKEEIIHMLEAAAKKAVVVQDIQKLSTQPASVAFASKARLSVFARFFKSATDEKPSSEAATPDAVQRTREQKKSGPGGFGSG
jgi:hypothetical protein